MNRYASVYFNMPGHESADYEKALIMELESNKIIELEPGELKYPLQMLIIGIVSALFLIAYIVYKTNKGI